jgi:hypothetical protein
MEAFRAAGDIARTIGDPQLLAQAAIGYEESSWRPGLHDLAVGPFEEALAAIVRDNAIALGRRIGDRLGVANVLVRSYWARGAALDEEILEMLTEAEAMGGVRHRDPGRGDGMERAGIRGAC